MPGFIKWWIVALVIWLMWDYVTTADIDMNPDKYVSIIMNHNYTSGRGWNFVLLGLGKIILASWAVYILYWFLFAYL